MFCTPSYSPSLRLIPGDFFKRHITFQPGDIFQPGYILMSPGSNVMYSSRETPKYSLELYRQIAPFDWQVILFTQRRSPFMLCVASHLLECECYAFTDLVLMILNQNGPLHDPHIKEYNRAFHKNVFVWNCIGKWFAVNLEFIYIFLDWRKYQFIQMILWFETPIKGLNDNVLNFNLVALLQLYHGNQVELPLAETFGKKTK